MKLRTNTKLFVGRTQACFKKLIVRVATFSEMRFQKKVFCSFSVSQTKFNFKNALLWTERSCKKGYLQLECSFFKFKKVQVFNFCQTHIIFDWSCFSDGWRTMWNFLRFYDAILLARRFCMALVTIVLNLSPSNQIIILQIVIFMFLCQGFVYKPFKMIKPAESQFLNFSNIFCDGCLFFILLGKKNSTNKCQEWAQGK